MPSIATLVMDQPIYIIGTVTAIVSIYGLSKLLRIGHRPADLPPGPPTVPFLGNLHLMPAKDPHLQFQKWAQEYGPIYSLMMGTRVYIVLSKDTVVKDLLDKRSGIYSSRPDMFLAQEIASGGLRFVVMKYGNLWRMMHRITHNILNIRAAVTYVPYQDLENKNLMVGLLDQPDEWLGHIRRFSNSLTTQMIFGFRTISINDPRLQQFFKGFTAWGHVAAGTSAQLLDMYPFLQKLPKFLFSEYRHAQRLHKDEMNLYKGHLMETKKAMLEGTSKPCFCNDLLRAQEVEKFNDDQASYISGSLLEAGSDTTAAILHGFVKAMLLYPEIQTKAQEEVDLVVGPDRLPTMDDAPNLQYIRGCVKESLRWMPTTILGVPHSVIKEDSYMGYRIPAGATVINNVWAINMDPERCPNPRYFDPSRYADDFRSEIEAANGDVTKRYNLVFGAGRRLCQGMHIAERSLFLAIARFMWGFNFERPLDAAGKPIIPDRDAFHGGLTVEPAPFDMKVTPRSSDKEKIMRNAWKECEDNLLDQKTKQWKKIPDGMLFSTYTPSKSD